jgi:enoyl-[acyl-carrier protein] reductase/trans-2-enoyl-CoA reductase (NAD+)
VDLVVYSVAAPRRTDPKTGTVYKSVLKPIGKSYTNKTLDFNTGAVSTITLDAATPEEVEHTTGVMGGDDWELWMNLLEKEGLLAPGAVSMAYSYIGPQVTQPVYRNGTIGTAKNHLENTAKRLDARLKQHGGRAFISVNKALVTQASSAIPFMPLYISLLYKVMKAKGIHEGTLEQMARPSPWTRKTASAWTIGNCGKMCSGKWTGSGTWSTRTMPSAMRTSKAIAGISTASTASASKAWITARTCPTA